MPIAGTAVAVVRFITSCRKDQVYVATYDECACLQVVMVRVCRDKLLSNAHVSTLIIVSAMVRSPAACVTNTPCSTQSLQHVTPSCGHHTALPRRTLPLVALLTDAIQVRPEMLLLLDSRVEFQGTVLQVCQFSEEQVHTCHALLIKAHSTEIMTMTH